MDYINAFWVGGLICALVQILLEKTTLLPGRRVMVILVCLGVVLGAVGLMSRCWTTPEPAPQCRCWDSGIRSGKE